MSAVPPAGSTEPLPAAASPGGEGALAEPASPGESTTSAERIGAWFKEFALYPFLIVLGIVGAFALFSGLMREDKDARHYLREIRTSSRSDRWYAAFQLSKLLGRQGAELERDPAFVQDVRDLFQASDEGDPRLQRYLAIVLGRVGDSTVLPALMGALKNDDDAETRMWSAWAMGAIGAAEAVPGLVGALEDTDPGVRKVAAYALGSLRDPRSIEPLRQRLQDEVEDVRWNAAIALALQSQPDGYPILRQMVDSRHLGGIEGMTAERMSDVMVNAVKALGVLQASDPSARDLLEQTRASAPFPLVQQEARKQLEPTPAGNATAR